MFFWIFIFVFILGVCWGSFANVLIDRTQNKKTIYGRSKCDYCGYKLEWFDNVPILSFLFLRGRCKKCEKKLSWQYPLVEFFTGVVFVIVFYLLQRNQIFQISEIGFSSLISLVYYFFVVYLLWVILVWDLKYMIIPDGLLWLGLGGSVVYQVFQIVLGNVDFISLVWMLLGGVVLSGFFGSMYYFSKGRWIGGGDVKLGFLLGFLVGIRMVYFLILIAYTVGAVVAIGMLLWGNKKMKSEIPFGPFLVLASFIVIFFQEDILRIWNSLI